MLTATDYITLWKNQSTETTGCGYNSGYVPDYVLTECGNFALLVARTASKCRHDTPQGQEATIHTVQYMHMFLLFGQSQVRHFCRGISCSSSFMMKLYPLLVMFYSILPPFVWFPALFAPHLWSFS